jgi:hypothetical protein
VVVAIVNMTSDRFDLVAGDCVGAMSNSVFEADGGIHKLNDESVNTIFGNIGKVPDDPKWGEGPPLEQKEKKVIKERLQVLAEEPWRQHYLDLMLRYHNVCSKDKFDLGCADVIEHRIVMEDDRQVHQRQFRVPFAHKEVLYKYVDKMLKLGAIEVSRSPYNSAVFCVAKKQLPNAAPGDPVPLRIVLDFRAVNLKSLPDRYCVKEVRECLDGYFFDVLFNFRLLATISPGEEQTVHGLLRARQGNQVPVEDHANGIAGLACVLRETHGFCHDGGKRHHYVH